MSDRTEGESNDRYAELAEATKRLAAFREYRKQARERKADAIRTETENIDAETERIEKAEAQVRELVAELGLK
jgi:hypothetical protein